MSLINDALKRASAQARQSPPGPAAPRLQPVLDVPARRKGMTAFIVAGVVLLIGCSVVFVVVRQRPSARSAARIVRANDHPVERTLTATVKTPAPIPSRALPKPLVTPPAHQVTTAPSSSPATLVPPSMPSSGVAAAPTFKLEAIHYRLTKPSARINNTTVYVGQKIDGAKVVLIDRHTVQLVVSGETTVLHQ